jgi:drug/metabolite transporter (DMT)-like permease
MWGINIPLLKYSIGHMDPIVFNAVRLVFAAIALAICAAIEYRWFPSAIQSAVNRRQVLVFAALSGFIYQFLFVLGAMRTTAGNAALLLSSMPMWTAVFSMAFLGERLDRVAWTGLTLTMLGTAAVTLSAGKVDISVDHMLGNGLMLAAAMTWAAATVVSRPILVSMSPLRLTFLASVLTAPIHILIVSPVLWSALPSSDQLWLWGALIYCGAFSTGFAYITWNAGVRYLGGSHAAVYQSLVTLIAVVGGWVFLREQPLWGQIVGGIGIIAGLMIMRSKRPTPRGTPA